MSNKTRITRITIERHSATIIHQKGKTISIFCAICHSSVNAISVDDVARRFHIDAVSIHELAQSGEIHFVQTKAGELPLICGGPANNQRP